MAFLDHDGLVKVWSKMLEKVNAKADSAHDHNSISGTASNVTGVVSISNGGTGSDSRGGGYQALQSAGTISGNFNDITTPGVYWVDLRECTNVPPCPNGVNHGILEVINNAIVYQRFTCFEYTMYIRTYANRTWQDWICIYSSKDVIGINNGGTGASNSYDAQMNLNIVHSHDIAASDRDDWRNKALAQIKENAKAGGFQCGSIGLKGIQFGQYFATTSAGTTDRILALIYNSEGTNYALEVWRYEGNVWNACGVKGASLQTMPIEGYGTAAQRPAAGRPGRIYFQKV